MLSTNDLIHQKLSAIYGAGSVQDLLKQFWDNNGGKPKSGRGQISYYRHSGNDFAVAGSVTSAIREYFENGEVVFGRQDQILWLPGVSGNYASIPDVNLLDADTAHLVQSIAGWMNDSGASSIARSTIDPQFGNGHLRWTSSAGGTSQVASNGIGDGVAVTAGNQYTFIASLRSVTATRTMLVRVQWLDSGGVSLGVETFGTSASVGNVWTILNGTLTAPATAAMARLLLRADGTLTGDEFYADKMCLRTGSDPTFVPSTRIVGDLDVRARLAVGQLGTSESLLGTWWSTAATRSWQWRRDTSGHIVLDLCDGITIDFGSPGSGSVPILPEDGVVNFRTTWDASGQMATKFLNGVQIAQDATNVSSLNPDPIADISIGGSHGGGAPSKQAILSFEVRDGIDGPVVASADFTNPAEVTGDSWITPEGHAATINTSGGDPARLIGVLS